MSKIVPLALEDCPAIVTLPVLWGDMDALGHVNNTIPIRWFECSRVAYLELLGDAIVSNGGERLGPILAAISCHYKRQLFYPDTVQVGCRVTRIGRSSMTMSHTVYSNTMQHTAALGESVVVVFDFERQRPVAIPDVMRARIEAAQK